MDKAEFSKITVFVKLGFFALLTAFCKTPTSPFTLWLPEAHVEGTHSGSILLAAIGMKFSLILVLLILTVDIACVSNSNSREISLIFTVD